MVQRKIPLERDWHRKGATRRLVPEGEYTVYCESIEPTDDGRIDAVFVIVSDDGPYGNRKLFERFDTEHHAAKLYEFVGAAGVEEGARGVSLKDLTGVTLRVAVRHRRGADGTYWANIVGYHPVPEEPASEGTPEN